MTGNECKLVWGELVWAAMTVGRAKLKHVLRHGQYSLYELVYRAAIVYANLRQGKSGELYRSDAYDSLDPSEKSAISYFLGLTITKLLADKYLGVPWLMHLDVYKNNLTIQTSEKSKSLPDLIGHHRSGDWYVLEAKGRTNGLDNSVIPAAKKQTQKLQAINGKPPVLRVASACYFDHGQLRIHWEDPEGEKGNLPDLFVEQVTFLKDYYEMFIHLLSEKTRKQYVGANDFPFLVADIPEADLSIGLSAPVHAAVIESEDGARIINALPNVPDQLPLRTFVGSDGILVHLGESWAQDIMLKEPEERNIDEAL